MTDERDAHRAEEVRSMGCPWCGRFLSIPAELPGVPEFHVDHDMRTITATRTDPETGKLLAFSTHGGPGAFGCIPMYRHTETLDVAQNDGQESP